MKKDNFQVLFIENIMVIPEMFLLNWVILTFHLTLVYMCMLGYAVMLQISNLKLSCIFIKK